ncbi:MAG: hypothetical protein GDA44_06830 [Prochloron sp. SP5CPC1]|nr:hypothetical protein [Candidatus Paraprochloron terpiosi SP5CPC1]
MYIISTNTKTVEPTPNLYDTDFHAWTDQQAWFEYLDWTFVKMGVPT